MRIHNDESFRIRILDKSFQGPRKKYNNKKGTGKPFTPSKVPTTEALEAEKKKLLAIYKKNKQSKKHLSSDSEEDNVQQDASAPLPKTYNLSDNITVTNLDTKEYNEVMQLVLEIMSIEPTLNVKPRPFMDLQLIKYSCYNTKTEVVTLTYEYFINE